jgi:hypothetical protein
MMLVAMTIYTTLELMPEDVEQDRAIMLFAVNAYLASHIAASESPATTLPIIFSIPSL